VGDAAPANPVKPSVTADALVILACANDLVMPVSIKAVKRIKAAKPLKTLE
jgi:hypothetical protein